LASGCAEYATFRSSPAPAKVYLNDQMIGLTPLEYPIPQDQVQQTWNYRVEIDGYEPDSGILQRSIAPGRIVAAVFTLCISCAFRGFQYFRTVDAALTQVGRTSAGADKGSPADRLRRLDEAYNQGLINEQEYRKLRSQILGDF
jgi:hypothetical protein